MNTRYVMVSFLLATAILSISLPINTALSAPMVMQEEISGNVTYITGGVGETEAAVMRDMAKDYLLEVSFIQKQRGQPEEFLANIKVQIQDDQQNTVLDITTDGPFLLANLPQGHYLVIAEHKGEVKQQKVSIDIKKHQKMIFNWPVVEQSETGAATE